MHRNHYPALPARLRPLNLVFVLLLAGTAILADAQPKGTKFGDVTPADFADPRLQADADAQAVLMYDVGAVKFHASTDIYITYQHKRRVYLRQAAAFDRWGTVLTPLLPERGVNIGKVRAYIYTLENGQVTKTEVPKADLIAEKPVRGTQRHRMNLPGLKEGAIIEYSYNLTIGSLVYTPSWQVQYEEPVLYSEFEIEYASDLVELGQMMHGYIPAAGFQTQRANQGGISTEIRRLQMENVPALRDEPFTLNIDNYRSRVDFFITAIYPHSINQRKIAGTYASIAYSLVNRDPDGGSNPFYEQLKPSNAVEALAKQITAGKTTAEAKLDTLYRWVQANIQWNGDYHYIPDRLNPVLDKKSCDSGTLNFLLMAMLNSVGVAAEPVLVSSRDHGMVHPHYANTRQFNHTLLRVKLDKGPIYVDAVDPMVRYPMIPQAHVNGLALLLHPAEGTGELVELPAGTKDKSVFFGNVTLAADGRIHGMFQSRHEGYRAHRAMLRMKTQPPEDWVRSAIFQNSANCSIGNLKVVKPAAAPDPMSAEGTWELADHAQNISGKLYFNPVLVGQMEKNPFVRDARIFPIEFGEPVDHSYTLILHLPEGATLAEPVRSQRLLMADGKLSYLYSVQQNGNELVVRTQLQINTPNLPAEAYADLKQFFEQMRDLQNQQLAIALP